jgi:hypothetical protein
MLDTGLWILDKKGIVFSDLSPAFGGNSRPASSIQQQASLHLKQDYILSINP